MPTPFELQLTLSPPRILGRRLCRFTLGHARLLEVAKSPFMGGAKIDVADLILATWFLTFPKYSDASRAALASMAGRVPRHVSRWGKKIGLSFDLEAEAGRLAEYLAACTKPPRTARRDGGKRLATPTASTLAVLHRHYFHTDAASVWDLPFLDAMLDVVVFHHSQGWIDLVSDKQAAFIEKVAALNRKKARK